MSEVKEVKECGEDEPELANDGLGVKGSEKIEREKEEEEKEEEEESNEEVKEVKEVEEEELKESEEMVIGSESIEENTEKDICVGNALLKMNDVGFSEGVFVLKACDSIYSDVKELVKTEKEALNTDMNGGDGVMLDTHESFNKHQGVDDEVGDANKGSCELREEVMKEEELKNEALNPDTDGGNGVMLDTHQSLNKHQGVDDEVGDANKGSCELREEVMKEEELKNEALNPDTDGGNGVMLDTHQSLNKHQGVDDEVGDANKGSCELREEVMKEEELKNEASNEEDAMNGECRSTRTTCIFDTDTSGGGESGTEDEQAAFIFELDKFHKERFLEFKPPKFYGVPVNLLKLWRAVMKLGGYDKVTACKYWRQIGESFKPPKTCTTVSWSFRIFYEKALLEYEKHRTSDGTYIPAGLPMSMSVENQASGSGRARRDAAARAIQGRHSQHILDNGEVSDPILKEKNSTSFNTREKQLKNLNQSILKQRKRPPPSMHAAANDVRAKLPKSQSETTVVDVGSPAEWVKINVHVTNDCYEVYALVPGLLREEVRVQSDPAGRLVISGEPENPENPWNVTPFKKVVNFPTRIDPHQTSAVVTLHGQLFVRVPFERYD